MITSLLTIQSLVLERLGVVAYCVTASGDAFGH
jgi:hypothetical protein